MFPFFFWRNRLEMTYMLSPPWQTQIPYLRRPAFNPSVQALKATAKQKIFDQVTDAVCREIDTIAPNFVSIATVPNFLDVRSFIWKKYRDLRFTHTIDLDNSLDEIWA